MLLPHLDSLARIALALGLRLKQRSMGLSLLLVLGLGLSMSGCLASDLTVHFDYQGGGQIVQSIHLSQGQGLLTSPNLETWLTTLQKQVRPLGGRLSRTPDRLDLVVPFVNSQDLEQRFSQTWTAMASIDRLMGSPLNPLPVSLKIHQTHWLLVNRNHLVGDFDLHSLRHIPGQGPTEASQSWVRLAFRLVTPWGSRVLASSPEAAAISPAGELSWQLQPGALNHLDVIFWLPDVVGIGSLIIALIVVLGYVLRYRLLAAPLTGKTPETSGKTPG
ncbi:MAG: DUF3153 domain-containing protein [Cyanobacteria bacterium REEB459]|nr:DUF3153 domain-containing protein [Cyanobacteria bacterium REEB459]